MIVMITLPPLCNLTVIQNKNKNKIYYIYSDFFFYKLIYNALNKAERVDDSSRSIVFNDKFFNTYNFLFLHKIHLFLYAWNFYFYEKIKFTGKGYRITFRKKKKYIIFYFGYSHITAILFRTVLMTQPHKYKFVLVKNNWNKLRQLSRMVTQIKPMNVYTKRGIRNSRQIIFKRKGSKATYI